MNFRSHTHNNPSSNTYLSQNPLNNSDPSSSSSSTSTSDIPTLLRHRASFSSPAPSTSTETHSIAYTHEVGIGSPVDTELSFSGFTGLLDARIGGGSAKKGQGGIGIGGREAGVGFPGSGSGSPLGSPLINPFGEDQSQPATPRQAQYSSHGLGLGLGFSNTSTSNYSAVSNANTIQSESSSPSVYSPKPQQMSTPAWGAMGTKGNKASSINGGGRKVSPTLGTFMEAEFKQLTRGITNGNDGTVMDLDTSTREECGQAQAQSQSQSEAERYRLSMMSPTTSTVTTSTSMNTMDNHHNLNFSRSTSPTLQQQQQHPSHRSSASSSPPIRSSATLTSLSPRASPSLSHHSSSSFLRIDSSGKSSSSSSDLRIRPRASFSRVEGLGLGVVAGGLDLSTPRSGRRGSVSPQMIQGSGFGMENTGNGIGIGIGIGLSNGSSASITRQGRGEADISTERHARYTELSHSQTFRPKNMINTTNIRPETTFMTTSATMTENDPIRLPSRPTTYYNISSDNNTSTLSPAMNNDPSSPISPGSTSSVGSPEGKRLSIMEGPKVRKYSFSAPWDEEETGSSSFLDSKSSSSSAAKSALGGEGKGEKGVLVVGKEEREGRGNASEPIMVWNDNTSSTGINSFNASSRSSSSKNQPSLSSSSAASVMGLGKFHLRNPFAGSGSVTGSGTIASSVSTESGGSAGLESRTTGGGGMSSISKETSKNSKASRRPNTAGSSTSGASKFTLKGIGGIGQLGSATETGLRAVSGGKPTARMARLASTGSDKKRDTVMIPPQSIEEGDSPVKSLKGEFSAAGTESTLMGTMPMRGMSTGAETTSSLGSMGSLIREGAYAVFTADSERSVSGGLSNSNRMTSSNSLMAETTSVDDGSTHRFDDPPGTLNSMMSLSAHAHGALRNTDGEDRISPAKSTTTSMNRSSKMISPSKSVAAAIISESETSSDSTTIMTNSSSGITPITEQPQAQPVRRSPSAQRLVTMSTGESEVQMEQAVNLMMGSGTINRGRSSQQLALSAAEDSVRERSSSQNRSRSRSRTMTIGPTPERVTPRKFEGSMPNSLSNRSTTFVTSPSELRPVPIEKTAPPVPGEKGKLLKTKRSGLMRIFGKDSSKKGARIGGSEMANDNPADKENATDGGTPELPPSAAELIKQAYQAATVEKKPSRVTMRAPMSHRSMAETGATVAPDARRTTVHTLQTQPKQPSDPSILTTPRRNKIVRSNSESSPNKSPTAPHLGKVRPISMMFPDMPHGSPERLTVLRNNSIGMSSSLTGTSSSGAGGGLFTPEKLTVSRTLSEASGRPKQNRMDSEDSFATARSGNSTVGDSQMTIELLQSQLVNARKAWHIQIIELESQIRELKETVQEAREEQLERMKDGSCPNCGCDCKAIEKEKERERLSSETARTAAAGGVGGGGSGGGSVLNRGRVKTGGARGVFGTGDLKQWS